MSAATMSRSTSSHQVSTLSQYGSMDPSASSATPHLAHLRQSSSIGLGLHHHEEHHFPTSADAYDVYEEIGVGAFATVYRAAIRETGEQVAIKIIDLDQFNTNWEEIRREIMIMSLVHNKNVVRILTSFVEAQDLWLVMELAESGSCAHIMKTIYPTGMKDEALLATILREVLMGLLYFHKDGRLHRDLKAGNVLITARGDVQLADFGVAGTLLENGDRKKARRTFTGTPCWMAPEVMEHNESGYDEKADIWSLGILAMELGYGRAPYAKFPPMKVMVMTLQEEPPTCEIYRDHSYEFSRHFHSLIEKCLRKDPAKRPSVKKLLEHKFFKAAKDSAYIIEKIVKRMPVKRADATPKVLNICELRHATLKNHEGDDGKPVSVGSWVFDKAEYDEFKRQAMEQKCAEVSDRAREASVQASYAAEDDTTPKNGRAASALSPTQRFLNLPSPQLHGRSPSGASAASASDSEDDGHRALPDFSPPPELEDTRARSPAISVTAAATAAKLPPVKVPSPSSATAHSSPAPSPGEHLEGRFRVSDDAEEEEEEEQEQQPAHHDEHGHYAESHDQAHDEPLRQSQSESAPYPAFHNDSFTEESVHRQQHHDGETHVGRFAVLDDEDESSQVDQQ